MRRLMAAAMGDAVIVLMLVGHRSTVIGQHGQWSVLGFQHHAVNRSKQPQQSESHNTSNHYAENERLLQAEAEGARARDAALVRR